jgi:polyribonucleotide nucleotidyltransferase
MVVYISWKNRNFASPKEDVKTYAPKILQEEFHFYWCVDWTWWKSDSRITETTGTTIIINEDPITEEGVIEILGTDPAGIEAVQN